MSDFWSDIEANAGKLAKLRAAEAEKTRNNRAYTTQVIAGAGPLFAQYRDKLASMQVRTEVEADAESALMTLSWSDGGSNTFAVGRSSEAEMVAVAIRQDPPNFFDGPKLAEYAAGDLNVSALEELLQNFVSAAVDDAINRGAT